MGTWVLLNNGEVFTYQEILSSFTQITHCQISLGLNTETFRIMQVHKPIKHTVKLFLDILIHPAMPNCRVILTDFF